MQNKIVEYKDLQTSLKLFFDYLKNQGIDYEVLKKEREAEIDSLNLSDEKKAEAKVASTDIHKKAVKNSIKSMIIEYLGIQIKGSQIKIETTFDWVASVLEDVNKEFGTIFTVEDKFSIALEVLGYVHVAISTYTTMNYDEKEQELIKKRAEENLKSNRAFGRDTKQIDSLGEA